MTMVGSTISHYRVIEELGRGGMGVVYKAEDLDLGRSVALKVLPAHAMAGEHERARFYREARSAAALSHAHIATIYQVDEHEGSPFIAMEFVDGESLEALVEKGPLPHGEAIRLGLEVASALEAAHEAGIVHRDIKSANVMLTKKSEAKVLDFGLAKSKDATTITQEGTTVGTIAYMSPEQARGEEIDARSDLFSLGVILYEMVTGQRPFKGAYESAVIYSILNVDPEPMTALRTGVPMELERIANKLMAKETSARYQSATDLIVDLKNLEKTLDGSSAAVATSVSGVRPNEKATAAKIDVRKLAYSAIAVIAIIFLALFGRSFFTDASASAAIDSIAVLPLVNMTGDSNNEYISDGMTEALINELGRIQALSRVISFTSVRQYKDAMKPLPEIGDELGISAVVEGSLKSSGTEIHIDVRLIDVQSEARLWEQSYQRALRDVPALQREVALAISQELELALTPLESKRLSDKRPVNPDAHRAYLQGRFFFNKRTGEGLNRALEYFQTAVQKDSMYALGYAGLSDTYNLLGNMGVRPQAEVKPLAKAAALKVLELDETLAEGHISLASIWLSWEWNFKEGEREIQRAIELNPNYVMAHQWNAQWSAFKGQFEDAIPAIRRALELDPLSALLTYDYGWISWWAGEYEEAITQLELALEYDPNMAGPYYDLYLVYRLTESNGKAIEAFEKYLTLIGYSSEQVADVERAYASDGMRGIDIWQLEDLKTQAEDRYVDPGLLFWLHARLGERDQALEWLETAYAEKSMFLLFATTLDAVWIPFLDDPRFQDVFDRIGMPE